MKKLFSVKPFTRKADAPPVVPASDFNTVSQLGHFAAGALMIFASMRLFGDQTEWFAFAMVVIFIGLKEAFIDPITESPIVAGSGLEDWALWIFGSAVAMVLIQISKLWLK